MQFSTFSSTREDSITGIYQTLSTVDQQEYLHPSWGSWKEFFNEVGKFSPIAAFFTSYSIMLLLYIFSLSHVHTGNGPSVSRDHQRRKDSIPRRPFKDMDSGTVTYD